MADEAETMFANLEKKTGKSKSDWLALVTSSQLEKHGQLIAMLKSEHGIGHGYANMIVHVARQTSSLGVDADELLGGQYQGKENLRLLYDRVAKLVLEFGENVELAPKKASVSLRRKKQFALIEPKTKTRIDIGINIKGHPGTNRLKPATGMCTHKVGVTSLEEVDDELLGWLKQAYDLAG